MRMKLLRHGIAAQVAGNLAAAVLMRCQMK